MTVPSHPPAPEPLLRLRGICRYFGTTKAVRDVDLDVEAGTVHALLGENGAGKSTLMNVVYGVHPAGSGTLRVAGRQVRIESPRQALELGIAMVHQHHQLIPSLTVAESVALASRRTRWRYDRAAAAEQVRRVAGRLHIDVDPNARVGDLSLADRQRLEIVSAIDRDSSIVILDEPTAVLAPTEVAPLFDLLRALAHEGRAVILITHRMKEVFAVSDRISVMRKGELIDTLATADTDPETVLDLVIPKRMTRGAAKASHPVTPHHGPVAATQPVDSAPPASLEADDLVVPAGPGTTGLRGLTLTTRPGEVLGIVGVEGNGQHELVEVLAGIRTPDRGTVRSCGVEQVPGVLAPFTAVVPEDRHREALVLELSSEENLVLPVLGAYSRAGVLNRHAIRANAKRVIEDFAVVTAGPAAPTRSMSGGNQQKLVLARALAHQPRVLVASQATRGLDPGAAAEVLHRLRQAAVGGTSVVFLGSDLDEVVDVSDRVAVIYGGRVVGEAEDPRADRDRLAELMVGGES